MREQKKERKLAQNQDQRKSRRNMENTKGETHKKKVKYIKYKNKRRDIQDHDGQYKLDRKMIGNKTKFQWNKEELSNMVDPVRSIC